MRAASLCLDILRADTQPDESRDHLGKLIKEVEDFVGLEKHKIKGDISEDSGPDALGTRGSRVTGEVDPVTRGRRDTVESVADGVLIGKGAEGVDERVINPVSEIRPRKGGRKVE